jgi:copper homeostasis protein
MPANILFCKEHGAKGIVTGLLNADGTVDTYRTAELVRLARPMQVTFHRAFDMAPDPFQAMEDAIKLGFHRILTSGQAANAPDGAQLICELIKQAAGRITIMPGGGINEENVMKLEKDTNAVEFHASLSSPVNSRMQLHNSKVVMGAGNQDDYSWKETDPERVRQFIRKLNSSSKIKS